MSDPLHVSMQKLKQSTAKVNRISDTAVAAVNQAEAFLVDCGIGIEAAIPAQVGDQEVFLAYTRTPSGFRICVNTGDSQNDVCKPWAEWDRSTKLATVKRLPELLEAISTQVVIDAKLAEEAEAAITAVTNSTPVRKGGK